MLSNLFDMLFHALTGQHTGSSWNDRNGYAPPHF